MGLLRQLDRAIIDEVQRAPQLLALKLSIDQDRRPGRFLLTGSANLLSLPSIADSLAGRMKSMRCCPCPKLSCRDDKATSASRAGT